MGRLTQIEQPNIITQLGYYADGQIAEKTYTHKQTGFKQTETFAYNLNSQLAQVKNNISQNDFYRDAVGQLVREHQHYQISDLKPMTAVLRYEYDELGNLIKTIRPDGQELSHLTYGSGHVYGVALNQHDLVAFQRDDLHRETTRLLANGLVQTSAYNDMGLLSRQSIQAEQDSSDFIRHQASRQYQYDQNYLLTHVEDSRLGKLSYQYDAIGRLTRSNSAQGTERFNFDPAGNLIDVNSAHTNVLKNNLVREYQGKYYRYDAQGNVIESQKAGEVLKLKWDNLNRLIESERNGQVTEYGYDVFGRRLYKKSHHNNQNQLTLFGWDGNLMIWESKQGSNPQDHYTKHYVYEPNNFVPLLQAGYRSFIQLKETPNYKELFKAQPYAMRKDPLWRDDTRNKRKELEKVAFYHCDQVGTPQTLSNERGECIWEITQNTWGEALKIQASDDLLEQSHIRFQGQYYDEETELHYNRYRYYEPYSARYISKDPIGLDGGINNSTYVSDPMQWIDPMGLNLANVNFMGNAIGDWGASQQGLTLDRMNNPQNHIEKPQPASRFVQSMNNSARRQENNFPNRSITKPSEEQINAWKLGRDSRWRGCKGSCQMWDYLSCSLEMATIKVGMVKNLRLPENEGWYVTTGKSSILKHVTDVPQNLKNLGGWSCSVGMIKGVDPEYEAIYERSAIVHEFVNGVSISTGGVVGAPLFGLGYNLVAPITTNSSMSNAYAHEFVIGSSGAELLDVSGTKLLK